MDAEIATHDQHALPTPRLPTRVQSDERLAGEAGAGSERAFTAIFQRYHQQLYRYCRGLTGNDQEAQDALQATFTNALVAMRAQRRVAPLRPWLYRIAHNESISVIRRRGATGELPLEFEASQAVIDSAELRERLAMLLADLRELPEQQRGALVMRELSGLSHEEIAEALQISTGAAKQSILEARRSLMEFAEGRAMRCDEIQRIVSDDDRRALRSRRVRAHLRDCGSCTAFAAAIPRRRADMLALAPALPAAGAAGLLARITGAGTGHGGGGAGLAAGGAAKGIGATISIKAATAAGVAVVATATVGAVAVLHRHRSPARRPRASHPALIAASHASSGHRAGVRSPLVKVVRPATSRHKAPTAAHKRLGATAGAHAPAQAGTHAPAHAGTRATRAPGHRQGSAGATVNVTSTAQPSGPTQPSNYGQSTVRSVTSAHHGPVHTAQGKPIKVNPSVAHKNAGAKVGHGTTKPKPVKLHKSTTAGAIATTRTTGSGKTHTTGSGRTHTTGSGRTLTTGSGKTHTTAPGKTKTIDSASGKTTGKPTSTTPASAGVFTSSSTVTAASVTTPASSSTTATGNGHGNSASAPGHSGTAPAPGKSK